MKKTPLVIALTTLALSLGAGLVANPTAFAQSATQSQTITKININTASDAQLLKIPGIGQRMLKEIKDYRPFKNIPHVRKELGKYMSKAQLDKLEQYIFVQ